MTTATSPPRIPPSQPAGQRPEGRRKDCSLGSRRELMCPRSIEGIDNQFGCDVVSMTNTRLSDEIRSDIIVRSRMISLTHTRQRGRGDGCGRKQREVQGPASESSASGRR